MRLECMLGGRSNITALVFVDAQVVGVLREPPEGPALGGAHDLAREFKVLSALAQTPIPAPLPLAGHAAPNGTFSYLMSYVAGTSLSDASGLRTWHSGELRLAAVTAAARALSGLHALPAAVFETAFKHHPGSYPERQLARWLGQWNTCTNPVESRIPEVHRMLEERLPSTTVDCPVHGDYHFGNILLGRGGAVAGVVDWELATIGDPLADFGTYLAYLEVQLWKGRLSAGRLLSAERDEFHSIMAAYNKAIEPTDLGFYLALAHWKIACIGEGVLDRFHPGQPGSSSTVNPSHIGSAIERHSTAAKELLSPKGSNYLQHLVAANSAAE